MVPWYGDSIESENEASWSTLIPERFFFVISSFFLLGSETPLSVQEEKSRQLLESLIQDPKVFKSCSSDKRKLLFLFMGGVRINFHNRKE